MIEAIQALPLETIINIVLFLTIAASINYSLPLAQAIVELLKELDKWQIQTTLKDTPPTPTIEDSS